ncbi:hypothetical protein KAW50_02265, partial [candidate division WOR-3 bacterium]|nr:hypothetical protein [candidate division WOR-3 bacterium]
YKNPDTWGIWGEKIFHEILPEVCKRLDPTRPYWPSSGWSAPGKFPLWQKMGDYHFYPVAGGGWRVTRHPYGKGITLPLSLENMSYRLYAKEKAKFYSEFGLASIPSLGSLEKIMGNNLWPIENNSIWDYNIAVSYPGPVKKFLERINLLNSEFGDIKNIDDFILYSQISQATTLKFAIEHFRMRKFSCSGALFWQYNDCWPTLTFSVIDYYLNKKIAYYWVKKAFSPLLITFIKTDKCVEVWVVNDLLSEIKGKFLLTQMNFSGRAAWDERKEIKIPSNSSLKVTEVKLSDLKVNKKSEFLWACLNVKGKTETENRYFFSFQRDLLFPKCYLKKRIEKISRGKYRISISSDTYAHIVKIDTGKIGCELTDNFFDIAPGEKKEITVKLTDLKQEVLKQFKKFRITSGNCNRYEAT